MATTIYFNGRTTAVPGSYSEVDASGLARVGLGAVGIIAMLGEAEGGAPYSDSLNLISNPGKLGKTFRSGDLLEGGTMLFDPSKDPGIPGGASQVYAVKVNPAVRASRTFDDALGADSLTIRASDWGVFTNQISLEFEAGTTTGYKVTVAFEDREEVFDNVGGDDLFSLAYAPATQGATTMTVAVSGGTSVVAAFTKQAAGGQASYAGRTSGFVGLDSHKLANVVAGNVVSVVSSSAGDVGQQVTVYGRSNAGSPVSETLVLNGTTPVVGATTWNEVHGAVLSAGCAGTVTVRDNGGPTTLYSLAPGPTSRGMQVFASPIEAADAAVTVVADGATTQPLIVVGTNSAGTPTLERIVLSGTTPVTTSTLWRSVAAFAIGYVEAARLLTAAGLLLDTGSTLSVASSNAGDTTQTVTVYGLDGAGAPQTETLALNGTTPVAGSATWSKVLGMVLSVVTLGTVTLTGSGSGITVFSHNGAASLYAGFTPVDRVAVAGSAVTIVGNGATTRDVLVVGLDAAGAPQAKKATMNGTTPVAVAGTWNEVTGVATAHLEAARTATLSGNAFSLSTGAGGYDTVGAVVSRVASLEGWTALEVSDDAHGYDLDDLDRVAATSVLSVTVGFGADLARLVEAINAGSGLVDAEKATGATQPPAYTSAPAFLSGGQEGTTSFGEWQAALDALKAVRVNTIVALTDDEAVHAAVVTHCAYMCGAGRSERDCILGGSADESLADLLARTLALNTRHARLAGQSIERFNTDGSREEFPPYFTACLAAGMQSGAKLGDSLTFKYVNALDVTWDDDDWTVVDDAQELIQGGVLVLEKVPNKGFRWLRNITTHRIDDNLAYTEGSVNYAVNFAVYEFRTALEAAVGKPGFAGTVNAMLEVAVAKLGQLVDAGAITTWRALTIELDADVMTVDVEIAPTIPVNFVKNTLHLVTTSLSAAA